MLDQSETTVFQSDPIEQAIGQVEFQGVIYGLDAILQRLAALAEVRAVLAEWNNEKKLANYRAIGDSYEIRAEQIARENQRFNYELSIGYNTIEGMY